MNDYVVSVRVDDDNPTLTRIDLHHNGLNVGYLSVNPPEADHIWLQGLKVLPAYRGRGLAKVLLGEAVRRYGAVELRLLARPYDDGPLDEAALARLYGQFGFVRGSLPGLMVRTLTLSQSMCSMQEDSPEAEGLAMTESDIKARTVAGLGLCGVLVRDAKGRVAVGTCPARGGEVARVVFERDELGVRVEECCHYSMARLGDFTACEGAEQGRVCYHAKAILLQVAAEAGYDLEFSSSPVDGAYRLRVVEDKTVWVRAFAAQKKAAS